MRFPEEPRLPSLTSDATDYDKRLSIRLKELFFGLINKANQFETGSQSIKLGSNSDESKNFLISVPSVADGTLVIERGNGTDVLRIDTSGNVLVISPSGLGYGPGAGGTVTQATSKATAVTLNKPCGRITMNAASLAANSSVNFTLINSQISNVDLLLVAVVGNGNYVASVVATAGGSAIIRLTNITGGAVAEAVGVNFTIIKGANS